MESPAVVKFYYISVVYLVIFRWGGTNPISKDFPLLLLTKSNISLSLMLLQLDKRKGNDSIHKKESCTWKNAGKKAKSKCVKSSVVIHRIGDPFFFSGFEPLKSPIWAHIARGKDLSLSSNISPFVPNVLRRRLRIAKAFGRTTSTAPLGNDERFIPPRWSVCSGAQRDKQKLASYLSSSIHLWEETEGGYG